MSEDQTPYTGDAKLHWNDVKGDDLNKIISICHEIHLKYAILDEKEKRKTWLWQRMAYLARTKQQNTPEHRKVQDEIANIGSTTSTIMEDVKRLHHLMKKLTSNKYRT